MTTNLRKRIIEYTAIFEPSDQGGYVVSVPVLAGCVTQGETFEEATENIKDAIKGYLSVLKDEGQTIPQEKADIVITKISIANPSTSSL